MASTYNIWLVVLSILVAIGVSYTAIDLASRIAGSPGSKAARQWIIGGGLLMGIGIWAMHFIGMLAMRLPIALSYDVPTTLLSLLTAIIASGFALHTLNRDTPSLRKLLTAGVLLGAGITSMHYIGMAALQLGPALRHEPILVGLSAIIAIGASVAALWIAVRQRSDTAPAAIWTRICSAAVMCAAIAGMHYTGMAAAIFAPDTVNVIGSRAINEPVLAAAIAAFTIVLLSTAL